MKLTPSNCPECGREPKLILETVYAETGLQPIDANGEIEFDCDRGSEVLWDSAKPAAIDGKVTVRCAAHHRWFADLDSLK